jgi:hypothetical protein
MSLRIFCLPVKNGIGLFPQYLRPENSFERFLLISSFVFTKYSLLCKTLVPFKSNQLDFVGRIPIKTRQITLVHSLPDDQLKLLLNKFGKITPKAYIARTVVYSSLLPVVFLLVGSNAIGFIVQVGLLFSVFKSIQKLKGSLVLERVLKNKALLTTNTLDVGKLKDLDKFEKENNIFLLKESLKE